MKRVLALTVFFALLLCAAPARAAYFTDAELRAMEEDFEERCEQILQEVYHPEYFDGGCAEWVNDQLILNGIGYWYKGYYCYGFDDGNRWFGDLDEGAVTESGYTQVKYGGPGALTDLVAEFGGYPVYNVVLCWEQGNLGKWEDSGHVIYVWCVYDGYVYYADTFEQLFVPAGHIVKRQIDDFLAQYELTNGALIGAVHFEGDEAAHYRPDERMYAEYTAVRDCVLRAAPAFTVNGEDTAVQEAGEGTALAVRGAYTDDAGVRWLKIDGGWWVAFDDVKKSANYSTLTAHDITVPVSWCYHHGFTMAGTIQSLASDFTRVYVAISDESGTVLAGGEQEFTGSTYSISVLDEDTYFEHFVPGTYHYTVEVENEFERATLVDADFTIIRGRYRDSTGTTVSVEQIPFAPADVNLDGGTDEQDLSDALTAVLCQKNGYLADTNGDGNLNLTDLYLIAQNLTN